MSKSDAKIEIKESAVSVSNSLHDKVRIEQPWSHTIENLFHEIQEDLKLKITKHDRSGYHFKKLDARYGYPAILLASIMVPVSSLLNSCEDDLAMKITNAAAYATIAIFSATSQYFNYGKKAEKHFNHSARYGDVLTDIRLELCKKAAFRQPADTFLQTTQMRVDSLNLSAPVIPEHIAFGEA